MSAGPRQVSGYELGSTVGKGVTAKVKIAKNVSTGEKVALKIMDKDKIGSNQLNTAKREIETLKLLCHPNIIRLKEALFDISYPRKRGGTKPVHMVIMELAAGGELFDFLAMTGPFEEQLARSYFHQLIEGIGYCHSKGISHRDLKPENLLFNEEFILKLADFGFAHTISKGDVLYTECGTRSYMAPELFLHKGYSGQNADIFAAGVILFIMLGGFPPFRKANRSDWWFNKLITNQHALFWQAHMRTAFFTDEVRDLLNKMLDANPDTRITLDMIKEHDWYKQHTLSVGDLFKELSQRKNDIEKKKTAERKEASGKVHLVNGVVQRDDELIPFPTNVEELKELEAKWQGPIPEPYKSEVANYTTFNTNFPGFYLLEAFKTLLQNPLCTFSVNEEKYKFKASFCASGNCGPVDLSIKIYSGQNNLYWVEFKRLQGDTMEFHRIYESLHSQITGVKPEYQVKTLPEHTPSPNVDEMPSINPGLYE